MDYEQYTIDETPVEEETENEIVPVETEEPEEKKSGNTAAGVAIGALLTIGLFAGIKGVKRAIKHMKAKATKKAKESGDDEWEDEPIEDEKVIVLNEPEEKKPENK